MAANEIPERIAAHAWVTLAPPPGNVNVLSSDGVGIRSQVGFRNALLGSSDVTGPYPLLILALDRELSRKQHHAIAYSTGTVDALGRSYPPHELGDPPRLYAVQPIMLEWLGNLAAPSWYPFGLDAVPAFAARDLDRFDALAIMPVTGEGTTLSGDLVALVLACAPQQSPSQFLPAIPSPTPPPPDPDFTLNWFGPSLSPGLVPLWVDLEQGLEAVNPFAPTQPVAAIGLNGLMTVQGSASEPLYCLDIVPTGTNVITLAAVVDSPEGAEQLFYSLQDDDGNGPNLQYYTADGPGLFFQVFSNVGTISEQLSSGPGVAAVVATFNPITGQYRVLVRLDWGPTLVFAGTDPTCTMAGDFNAIGFNASIPYESEIVTQLAQCKVYGWPSFPSSAQQAAILAELQATWEPGPVIVPVGSNPEVQLGATPSALNSSKWRVTIANDFASPNAGFQAILVSDDFTGGAGLWLHDNALTLYSLGGTDTAVALTWDAGQPISVTVDPDALTLEVQGAASGNGVVDISAAGPPWYEAGTDLFVGCFGDVGSFVWQGTISDVNEVV